MSSSLRQEMLQTFAEISDLARDVRFGQLLANLGFIAECESDSTVWDIEDEAMLKVLQKHRNDLLRLSANSAERSA